MSIFQQPKPETLSEWLDVATRKLSTAAKARICSEIEAHFVEAVDEHMQNGSSDAVAQSLALEQLGDPKAAARRFRKHHLTEKDAKLVVQLINESKSVIDLLTHYGLFIIAILMSLDPGTHVRLYLALELLLLVLFPTVAFLMVRIHQSKGNIRLMLLTRTVGGYLPGLLVFQCFLEQGRFVVLLNCCAFVCYSTMYLPLWKKLGCITDDWAEATRGCKPAT